MHIKVTLTKLPAGLKYIHYTKGKTKYMCGKIRLPKFLWGKL